MKKTIEILKAAGEYCTIGAGVATIFVSVVGAFVAFPVFVTLVIAAGVGVICGLVGAYYEEKKQRRQAHRKLRVTEQQEQAYQEFKLELDEIKKTLDERLETVVVIKNGQVYHPHPLQVKNKGGKARAQVAHCDEKTLAALQKSKAPFFAETREYCNDGLMEEKQAPSRHSAKQDKPGNAFH